MAIQTINIGSSANKGDGDPLRTAFKKINENFAELDTTNTIRDIKGSVFGDDSTLLVDAVNSSIPSSVLSGNLPALDGSALTGVTTTETDPIVGAITGIVKADGSGNISAAVAGTDYLTTVAFTDITSKPTTIAGYGITDALALGTTASTALAGNTALFDGNYGSLSGTPTLFSGAYADLSGKPTIPSNVSDLTNDSGFITSVPAQTFASLTSKPSTISGYGITDAYTGAFDGDFTGSVFGDDSGLLVDAVNNKIVGAVDTASLTVSSTNIALGNSAGLTGQNGFAIAIGTSAGLTNQSTKAVAIGDSAGATTQGEYAVAIGNNAGNTTQGANSVAIGSSAGEVNQSTSAVAIGEGAGKTTQSDKAVAIGYRAGQTTQSDDSIAIGWDSGLTNQGERAIAMGRLSGETNQGAYAVAIGNQAGEDNQGEDCVAIGKHAGETTQGEDAVAIGNSAGETTQGGDAVAIGNYAANENQGADAIAIGDSAGYENQGADAIAVGSFSGNISQGANAIAIGERAGHGNQAANSIVINATGSTLNNTTASSLVIKPIVNLVGTTHLQYHATSGQVTHSDTITAKIVATTATPPTANADAGDTGEIRYDDNYLYIKTASGWKRTALSGIV